MRNLELRIVSPSLIATAFAVGFGLGGSTIALIFWLTPA